jgi:hypothetical protein
MRYLRGTLVGMALSIAMGTAGAETGEIPLNPALRDRFYFGIGAFYPRTTTEAQLNSSTGIGANVTLEDSLGMDDRKAVPNAIARIRFGERWRFEAEWFQLNRDAQRVVNRDIQFGDQVFPINTQVSSSFDFYDLRLSAGYSFFKRPDKELGVGLGLHVAQYDISLAGANLGSQQEDVLAPLPVISLYGQFALTDQWAVGGRLDRFALNYDKFSGSLSSMALDLTWQPFRHVGFGIGYRSLFIRMEAEDVRTLKFKQTFEGPTLFVTASF